MRLTFENAVFIRYNDSIKSPADSGKAQRSVYDPQNKPLLQNGGHA